MRIFIQEKVTAPLASLILLQALIIIPGNKRLVVYSIAGALGKLEMQLKTREKD